MDFILAFSAGLLSFLSPCVLPLIPAYLSYLAGSAAAEIKDSRARVHLVKQAAFFAAGFSLIFIVLGVTVSSISQLFSANLNVLKKAGGILVLIFGLHMTGLIRINLLFREKRFHPGLSTGKHAAPFFLGMAFAFGWTPCVGPILSSILIYAGSTATVWKGTALLSVYSLGLAVPFLLSALAVHRLTAYLKKFKKVLPAVSVVSGILMMVMGVLILTDSLSVFSRYFSIFNL